MKKIATSILAICGSLAVAGCPEKEDDPPPPPKATAAPAPTPKKPTKVVPDEPDKNEGIPLRAKAELDGKDPKGAAGSLLIAAGTKASFTTPKDWKMSTKGGFKVATGSKGSLAVGKYDAEPDANKGATALGLSGCMFNPGESIALGKEKLAAETADGKCKKGGADVPAVMVSMSGDTGNVVAVGTWSDGGDNSLFEALRSAKKAGGKGGAGGIAACCAALRQNAKSAPPQQQPAYQSAIALCSAAMGSPQGRAALAAVRAAVASAGVPSPCR
jgi:hypothetical protein